MSIVSNLSMPLDAGKTEILCECAKKLHKKPFMIEEYRILKRSVDARNKQDVHFVYTLDVRVKDEPLPPPPQEEPLPKTYAPYAPVVVGLGPAGLFAAWHLARLGMRPVILERGKDVENRKKDTQRFQTGAVLNPESNIQFGEGGAGAFSDGKLVTGISDERIRTVLQTLYEHGAPEEILYEAKPHIGTDRLPGVVRSIREDIERMGGTVYFETRMTGLRIENGRILGVLAENAEKSEMEINTRDVILAVGHSARDTFEMLSELDIPMQAKPFSIGARIEHRQSMVNAAQYGAFASHPALGAADYKLNVRLSDGRGAYTFCMCPGGEVLGATSEEGCVVTNGMSPYLRDGVNANSAVLIGVEPSDFGGSDALAGVRFQRKWEQAAFRAGGSTYAAPAQLVGDLLAGRPSQGARSVMPTYRPGVVYTDLAACMPDYVYRGLREAVSAFDRKLHGFAHPDAVLTGVETRSSSPVRVLRDENCMSMVAGLFPCGEGAGYAGGITSAAVDGLRCAQSLAKQYQRG